MPWPSSRYDVSLYSSRQEIKHHTYFPYFHPAIAAETPIPQSSSKVQTLSLESPLYSSTHNGSTMGCISNGRHNLTTCVYSFSRATLPKPLTTPAKPHDSALHRIGESIKNTVTLESSAETKARDERLEKEHTAPQSERAAAFSPEHHVGGTNLTVEQGSQHGEGVGKQ